MSDADLVVVALPGVQQFIAESRTTADAAAASRIISALTRVMTDVAGGGVVFPAPEVLSVAGVGGLPNRLVVRCPPNTGEALAARIQVEVGNRWNALCDSAAKKLPSDQGQAWRAATREAVGFPRVQWVVVPAAGGGYVRQWATATAALDARKRVSVFPGYDVAGRQVCGVTGRWAAVPPEVAAGTQVRTRRGEALSVPALVKRAEGADDRFPSTWSVATAPFRRQLITAGGDRVVAATAKLQLAVAALANCGVRTGRSRLLGLTVREPAELRWLATAEGAWLFAESWDAGRLARDNGLPERQIPEELCAQGRAAVARVLEAAEAAKTAAPTPYLAVMVQDADRMGERLSRFPDDRMKDPVGWHQDVSSELVRSAQAQAEVLAAEHLGRVVYAGGDDVLGFVPVSTALSAAEAVNTAFATTMRTAMPGVTASTAVVFFHAASPLQAVFAAARQLLGEAKEAGRPGLGLAVLRRGGERVAVCRGWAAGPPAKVGTPAVSQLQVVAEAMRVGLSGRLATSLERDREQLATLSHDWLRRELTRLVRRHGARVADLDTVASAFLALRAGGSPPAELALVARFVASEGRE